MKSLLITFIAILGFIYPVTLDTSTASIAGSSYAYTDDDEVVYNTKSHKYHIPSCIWAKRCTRNCIDIKRKEAQARGGVPCKVCGAGEY